MLIGSLLRQMVAFYEQDGVEGMFDNSMRIYRLLQLVCVSEASSPREEDAIERTIRYVRGNVGKQITLEELAKIANMSVYYFFHIFKQATGFSPIEYVISTHKEGVPMVRFTDIDYSPHVTMPAMSFRIWEEFFRNSAAARIAE